MTRPDARALRAGSIFAEDAAAPLPTTETPEQTASARVKTRTQPLRGPSGDVPGSERILSVSDRAVDSPALAADSPVRPENQSVEAAQPLPASGWTARRSADETLRQQ